MKRGLTPILSAAVALCAALLAGQAADKGGVSALRDTRRDAVHLLEEAGRREGANGDRAALLVAAAGDLDSLADSALFPDALRTSLRTSAGELRSAASTPKGRLSLDPYLELLARVSSALDLKTSMGLAFQGSYSQTKVQEPVTGGHASAMGPPPVRAEVENRVSPVRFEEVPAITAKTYCGGPTKDHILESPGSGIALVDYDNDGLLDIFVVNAYELDAKREPIPHKNALYKNLGNWKFRDVSKEAGVDAAAWGNGVCAGDFDGDGLLDLYVTNWGGNFLYRNNGDGTFTDVAEAAGVKASGWSTGCAFLDGNGDGKLDLYVARYVQVSWDEVRDAKRTMTWRGGPSVMAGPAGMPGEADLYFENQGNGTFAEVTDARGLTDSAKAYGFGVLATDYDNDGFLDLFVANDSVPNFLYRNRGGGGFESTGLMAGVALNAQARAQAGMGADAGDYDNDGFLDIVMTAFAHDTNTLFRNLGNGSFEDVTESTGLAGPTFEPMSWGVAFLDADLDGQLDLFFANGHIYPQVDDFPSLGEHFRQKSAFFWNDKGHFHDVSQTAGGGLQVPHTSRGLAVGDLDNDGDLDIVLNNMDEAPTILENRQSTGHHWVGFRLQKEGDNRFAIGARVAVESSGRRQIREVRSGGSYLSQSDLRAHFGLGSAADPVDVEVSLGGAHWRFLKLGVDRYHTLFLRDRDRVRANP